MESDKVFSISQCPRCKNIINIESKICSKCGIDIEDLKGNCAKCGSVYILGKRFCAKCKAPLIEESMGMAFNDVGIVYFSLRDSEYLYRAELYFKNLNYVESFIELQKEENLAQIIKLYKEDLCWIQECLFMSRKRINPMSTESSIFVNGFSQRKNRKNFKLKYSRNY